MRVLLVFGIKSGLIILFACVPTLVFAEDAYPNRPIKIVVPVSAGGAPDLVARIVSDKLSTKLGQPVIIENRPGAGERIGAEYVAKADPDGYTLLAAPPGVFVLSPLLFSKLPFDPAGFVPVTVLTTGHLVLLTQSASKIRTVQELVDLAKAQPGKLTYASPGIGTPPHMTGELFTTAAHIQVTHVPYKGLAPAITDLLAGNIDFMFDNLGNSLGHIRDGRLKALAVAGDTRIPELPNVPSIAEFYPTVRSTSWFAVAAPPKTPIAIVYTLSRAIGEVLHMPEVSERLRAFSFTPVGNSPEEAALFLKGEADRWRAVAEAAGIKPH